MLVLFLILFTNVLADSEEDKYVDLLPDAEKREFIERVARRILKDVKSQEDRNNARSGEMSDDDLMIHNEYVKSILKEEADYVRRSKGENVKDKSNKASDEAGTLNVKPLDSGKVALEDPGLEQDDLTLRNDRMEIDEDENSKDFIKVEVITDEAPIIKRSVQEDSAKNNAESDENTAEILERVQSGNNANKPKAGGRRSDAIESNADDPSVGFKNEDNTTETTTTSAGTTSVVEEAGVELNSNQSNVDNIIKSVNNDTTVVNITENVTTQSTSTTTTTPATSTLSDITTIKALTTTIEASTTTTQNKITTEISTTTEDETPTTTTENEITSEANEITSTTTRDEVPATVTQNEITTEASTTAEDETQTENETTKNTENELDATTQFSTESTLTSTYIDEGTETVPESTTAKAKIKTTTTEKVTVTNTPKTSTHSIFIPLTEGIIVEDFTSAPKKKPLIIKTVIKKRKINVKHRALEMEVTTEAPVSDEIEKSTTKPKLVYHKVEKYILGPKGQKIKEALDKAQKLKSEKDDSSNKNFIELQKAYYDNNYKVKKGKEYQVYEIPAGKSPFILDEDKVVAEQPYYVPIYTYSADNAYFNPQNRLGPNTNDASPEIEGSFAIADGKPQLNHISESPSFDMEYSDSAFDNQRKKFGGQQIYHSIHKQPQALNVPKIKKRGKPIPEDYLDADYYYGRIRNDDRRANQEETANFPNSNENDHPTHSMLEGNLKDHVRAVRNILFHQKSFGLLQKDKYGDELRTNTALKNMKKSESKYDKKPHILRTSQNEDEYSKKERDPKTSKNKDPENNIAIDYYFGRENKNDDHFQKVGYLQDNNTTKELFVMDDDFKANVLKYMDDLKAKRENADLQPATPLPPPGKVIDISEKQTDEILNFREQEKIRNANMMINSETDGDKQDLRVQVEPVSLPDMNNAEDTNTRGDENPDNIENSMESQTNEEMKLKFNNRRNDDVRVSAYLKVLKDMIQATDNNALKQYDWLGTTVDVQSGLQKMFELIALVKDNGNVHPADLEILKYMLFLHKLSTEINEANDFGAQLRKKLLPRNKKKRKAQIIKDKGLINRVWLYLRREVPEINSNTALKSLNTFLINIEDILYDLHDAIKHIAKITKYRNQQWYNNLKDLYVNTDEKHLLEILLHMSVLRFFSLIEESTKYGLERDYVQYMKDNKKTSKRTLEEMVFIMQILADYNKFVK